MKASYEDRTMTLLIMLILVSPQRISFSRTLTSLPGTKLMGTISPKTRSPTTANLGVHVSPFGLPVVTGSPYGSSLRVRAGSVV